MKTYKDYFTFVYKARIYDDGVLCLPAAWKHLAANMGFKISSAGHKRYLFTPSADGYRETMYIKYTDDEPAEEKIDQDIFIADEDGCFDDGLGDGLEYSSCFWVGLGDEFMLVRTDIPAGSEKSADNNTWTSAAKPFTEHSAIRKIMLPKGNTGKSVYEAAKDLSKIRCQYNLFAMALTHPDKTMAGLAAAAISDQFLLRKLTELSIALEERQSIGIYTAFRLGSAELFHLKATWFSEILQIMTEANLPAIPQAFRLQKIPAIHGIRYHRNCLSDCHYEDKSMRRLRHMTDPVQILSYAAKEPYVDVYRQCIRSLKNRQDMILWAALFFGYELDRSFATIYLEKSCMKDILRKIRQN